MYKEIVKHKVTLVEEETVLEVFGQVGIVDIYEHRSSTMRATVFGKQYIDTTVTNTYYHRN